ncbi:hypothetical protein SAY87_015458 [Trapa incisa]|uniref:Hydroxyproline-rich glycoprotein family protein n=2 Tax=Trapa TaxID=22665 RepID=A0AAN7RLK4_TRANT|nr:hypothetical protein SAY87_015458 [Trapa incisa]KAK4802381.1 hypothetical protein SAY86_000584 [Trapa natans]
MQSHDASPPHADAFRPSLGFPLGTALLLLIIFSLSGIFSCCYHWDKIRSLRRSNAAGADPEQPPLKPNPDLMDSRMDERQSMPVLMPGDAVPKFIALPCPCRPPKEEKLAMASVQGPPPHKLPAGVAFPSPF